MTDYKNLRIFVQILTWGEVQLGYQLLWIVCMDMYGCVHVCFYVSMYVCVVCLCV